MAIVKFNQNKKMTTLLATLLVIACILALIVLCARIFLQNKHQQETNRKAVTPTPKSKISLAPKDKKPGWKIDVENKVLDNCPVRFFNENLCICVLAKLEKKYSADEAKKMLEEFQSTQKIDPEITSIINECK